MNTQPEPQSGGEKPHPLPDNPWVGPVPDEVDHGESFFSPWPNWRVWIVLLAGMSVGHMIGFSPLLFVLIGALCLGCGWFCSS